MAEGDVPSDGTAVVTAAEQEGLTPVVPQAQADATGPAYGRSERAPPTSCGGRGRTPPEPHRPPESRRSSAQPETGQPRP
nr:hypothetical protein [Streptomyces broussonetiae]